MPVHDVPALIEDRVDAIRELHRRTGVRRAEIDVSGGIDSATMIQLLARALGPENVTAAFLGIDSSADSRNLAIEAAQAAGVPLIVSDFKDEFDRIVARMREGLAAAGYDLVEIDARMAADPLVKGSLRSCLRAPIGRGFNRMTGGGIRHGTGNECEDRFLRFYQKGGDGEVDTNPIAMLSKGEVYQLARGLGAPKSIIDAIPSPDLFGNGAAHNDEDELLASYGVAWTYSRVAADTGEYLSVGTIERLSRFLDLHEEHASGGLFGPTEPDIAALAIQARATTFSHLEDDQEIARFLTSARHIEASTRHKWNPNCPALGDRDDLVARGILTNDLPER